jgi:hypothetical protein
MEGGSIRVMRDARFHTVSLGESRAVADDRVNRR